MKRFLVQLYDCEGANWFSTCPSFDNIEECVAYIGNSSESYEIFDRIEGKVYEYNVGDLTEITYSPNS